MKSKNFLSNLWSLLVGSQRNDVEFDRRLTVGSPSGFTINWTLKLVSVLVLVLTIGSGNVWGQSTTYTSNVTFTAGTNGSTCKVIVTGSTQYDGMKLGTSSKTGTMTFTVPAGTTTIHIHAAGWNSDGGSRTLNISTSRGTLASGSTSMALTNDAGVSSSSPFTLSTPANASTSYYKSLSISGVTGGTATITITTSSKRAVVWGVNAVVPASCTTNPTVTAGSNSSVTATTATVSCSSGISSLGSAGCSISSYGFVLNTTGTPTISDTKHQVGTTYTTTGTSFSKDLTGLSAETTYYVRPYATNGNGTAYGTQTSFTTPALPKYTVTLMDDGDTRTQASYEASVTLPSRTGCTGYTFAGWTKTWVAPQSSWTTTAPTIIPAGSYTPSANENLYPVYTKTEGGGGSTTESYGWETSDDATNWTISGIEKYDTYKKTGSYSGKIARGSAGESTIAFKDKVKVTSFSFQFLRQTTNNNYNVRIETSSDGSSWDEVENYNMSAFSTKETWYAKSHSFDGKTALYVRFVCYTSTAVRWVDDISITYVGGSTTYYISVPGCCTNWSTPTVSYSSSLAINASEAVTISSGTTHGAVTYESSDEDVLTVDADGTIHAVGAGTAHITATWAGDATYCEKSANSNDVTVSGIQVTGTTPVNFGQVYQNAVVADKTIAVTGLGLTSNIIPSLPSGSPFSFSPASLAKDCSGATLTISASTATLGTYNQTLTLTSGAFSATVTVKMEVIAKPTATFTDALHELTTDKNGASLNSFNLEAAQGTPVVFPTLANQTKSAGTCEGEYYIFAGWTEGDNNTDPQDHLVTSHTLANGDAKHYYAVWADASGSVTYTKLTSNSFSTSAHYVIGAESGGTDYFLYSCEKTDANNSWGLVSSDPATDAPIQFTLSGTASALVAASTEATTRYLKAASGKQFFGMSSSSTTVVLGSGGTIESTADTYNNLRYNSAGGLRWYTGTTTGDAVYFYEVGSSGTVHYRTSCCANKVDAPVVTATTVTSTSITLTWPADVKATGWEVSWNGGAFGAPSGTCTHTVSGLTPNTTYTWKVRATYNAPQCGADTRSGSTTTHQVYHVTYAKGSGTGSCTASGSTTDETGYEAGATVTLQANEFLLSGHTFAGWTEDDEDITISSNQFTMPDHDVVITASWTAKVDKYFDRMHDQTDASHGGVAETEGTNEGKYYILKEGCSYSVPTAVDSKTGDACQTSHYKLRGWIAASYVNSKGEITDESKIFSPGTTKTAGGYTYYAVWAEVVE